MTEGLFVYKEVPYVLWTIILIDKDTLYESLVIFILIIKNFKSMI